MSNVWEKGDKKEKKRSRGKRSKLSSGTSSATTQQKEPHRHRRKSTKIFKNLFFVGKADDKVCSALAAVFPLAVGDRDAENSRLEGLLLELDVFEIPATGAAAADVVLVKVVVIVEVGKAVENKLAAPLLVFSV